jgi:hypothetical protein
VLLGAYRRMTAGGWLLLERANANFARFLQQNGLPTIGSPTSDDAADITAHLPTDPPQIEPGSVRLVATTQPTQK